ncbi:hypothetical protein BGX30_014416 [Mortierella sp. GBA39]|nr:hypothetical protein BGX30_014416 [Mortierella sp. GBA39]
MTAVRQDAWSSEDDLILAEVTLRHIREGSTQLAAFEEVGEKIGRTAAACGFRWNSCVRKKYEEAISLAKTQRQKRSYYKKQPANSGIQWKGSLQENGRQLKMLEKELREKEEELNNLRRVNERLSREVSEVQTDYRVVNDDYKALIQIMDRARRLAFLNEEDEELKSRFKMDANGNLERIE